MFLVSREQEKRLSEVARGHEDVPCEVALSWQYSL